MRLIVTEYRNIDEVSKQVGPAFHADTAEEAIQDLEMWNENEGFEFRLSPVYGLLRVNLKYPGDVVIFGFESLGEENTAYAFRFDLKE